MSDIDKLRSLLERVESADVPDRGLDADLAKVLLPEEKALHHWPDAGHYTGSIDEAVALLGKVMPGWWWTCGYCRLTNDGSVWSGPQASLGPDVRAGPESAALLAHRKFDEGFHGDRRGGNVPLALLSAMLQGLIAMEEHKKAEVAP